MKINTDLVDATMMVSFIVLVLVGTTTYKSMATKDIVMAALGVLCVAMVVLHIVAAHQRSKNLPPDYNN